MKSVSGSASTKAVLRMSLKLSVVATSVNMRWPICARPDDARIDRDISGLETVRDDRPIVGAADEWPSNTAECGQEAPARGCRANPYRPLSLRVSVEHRSLVRVADKLSTLA